MYTYDASDYFLEEVNQQYEKIDKFVEVYEAATLLNSFAEEIRLIFQRASTLPQKRTFKFYFHRNNYDTPERLHEDLKVLLGNYRAVKAALADYPLWSEKFENDMSKLFAVLNINFDTPEIYDLIDQQKIFK